MACIESSPDGMSCQGGSAVAECNGSSNVVWLRGEHDFATMPHLSKTLIQAIAFDDADVVLDMSAVAFMDASTVGAIVSAGELLGERSRLLLLRSPSRSARRLIDLCGLSHRLEADPAGAAPVGAAPRIVGDVG